MFDRPSHLIVRRIVPVFFLVWGLGASWAQTPPAGYSLYWSDEFNGAVGSAPNSANWTYDTGDNGWGNAELENYTNSLQNSQIVADPNATDGKSLAIIALDTDPGSTNYSTVGRYTSARLLTNAAGFQGVTFQYGYMEARIQMPYGDGIWPAFWMLGTNINTGTVWPNCGETDIMENIGEASDQGNNHGSLHAPNWNPTAIYTLPGGELYHNAYHTFGVLWQANQIDFYVDGTDYETQTLADATGAGGTWEFNSTMFFLLNMAVGGNYPGSPDASTSFPQTMLVDYVRVYEPSTPTPTPNASATSTPSSTATPSPTGTNTATSTPTKTASITSTVTATPTPSATPSDSPTATRTNTATNTATFTATYTTSPTPTDTMPNTSTSTPSPSPTATASPTRTDTLTNTETPTALATTTPTPTASNPTTPTFTATPTLTETASPTPSRTGTATNSATASTTSSPTGSATPTSTPTASPTFTASSSTTSTPTATFTGTSTHSPTLTHTSSMTPTITFTGTATPTLTNSSTFTMTPTPTIADSPTLTNTAAITSTPTVTAMGVVIGLPFPNPVMGSGPVAIPVQAPAGSSAEWSVFTTAFRKVLYTTSPVSGGSLNLVWNLQDQWQKPVASGLYYLRVQVTGPVKASKVLKVLVLR